MPGTSRPSRLDVQTLRILLIGPFDVDAWARAIGADCHLRVAGQPVAVGRDRCLAELAIFLRPGRAIGVTHWDAWKQGSALIAETELVALPEVAVPLPCVVIARVLHRRVRDLRFYLDPTPLARWPETAH